MDDVASAAGVSRALVSLVMRGSPKVSRQRRSAVLSAAGDLGYAPDLIARQLASRTSTFIGVIAGDLYRPGIADLLDGIDTVAETATLQVLVGAGGRRSDAHHRALATVAALRPSGLVILDPEPIRQLPLDLDAATPPGSMLSGSIPAVLAGSHPSEAPLDSVIDDGLVGTGLLVDHLVMLGHRLIAHLDGEPAPTAAARRQGYQRAMLRHGLTPWVVPAGVGEPAGATAIQGLLGGNRPFTALCAAEDLCAIGALSALESAGVAVPEEVSVVGYGNTPSSALSRIGLTTAGPRRREIGELAARTLLERIRNPGREPIHHLVTPQLVIRRTGAEPSS
jgi:DNA-binding LacI/PurR family transcriptional regulator